MLIFTHILDASGRQMMDHGAATRPRRPRAGSLP